MDAHDEMAEEQRKFTLESCTSHHGELPNRLLLVVDISHNGRWIVGTWAIAKDLEGNKCATTVPLLYSFCLALVVIYWIGVFFGIVGLIRVVFGSRIQSGAEATVEKVPK